MVSDAIRIRPSDHAARPCHLPGKPFDAFLDEFHAFPCCIHRLMVKVGVSFLLHALAAHAAQEAHSGLLKAQEYWRGTFEGLAHEFSPKYRMAPGRRMGGRTRSIDPF